VVEHDTARFIRRLYALKVIVFTQEIIFVSNELEEVRKIAKELLERENTLKDKLAQEKDKLAQEKDRVIDVTNEMIVLANKNMEMSNQIADISRKLFATTPRDVIGTTCFDYFTYILFKANLTQFVYIYRQWLLSFECHNDHHFDAW